MARQEKIAWLFAIIWALGFVVILRRSAVAEEHYTQGTIINVLIVLQSLGLIWIHRRNANKVDRDERDRKIEHTANLWAFA